MKMKLKSILIILALACFFGGILWEAAGCIKLHPDPVFNIGNNFSETVTVNFNGQDVGKIKAGAVTNFIQTKY